MQNPETKTITTDLHNSCLILHKIGKASGQSRTKSK